MHLSYLVGPDESGQKMWLGWRSTCFQKVSITQLTHAKFLNLYSCTEIVCSIALTYSHIYKLIHVLSSSDTQKSVYYNTPFPSKIRNPLAKTS